MDKTAATSALRSIADSPMGSVLRHGRAPSARARRPFVAGLTILDSSQPAGPRLDQPKSGGGEILGFDSRPVEPSARPFDALGKLGVDYCEGACFERFKARLLQDLNRDAFLGQVAHATSTYEAKPATITLAELKRTATICEEISRQSPFQWCQAMPKDAPYPIRCEGKYYFGLHKWRELSDAMAVSQSAAMALLLSWEFIDLDAAMAEHKRKWK